MAVTSSGLSSDASDAGLPSEKVVVSGKNGDGGDLLLFQDGPGAGDISPGTLRLFISWECSRPVTGVKVSPSLGNWVAREVGKSILLGMECPVAASYSGELSGMLLESDLDISRIHPAYDKIRCIAHFEWLCILCLEDMSRSVGFKHWIKWGVMTVSLHQNDSIAKSLRYTFPKMVNDNV
ncbi:hypothetical protein Tco_1497940 [Tanacetum coccineum]